MGASHVHLSGPSTNVAEVLAAAPGSDSGQAALAVRVVSQLGAGSSGVTTPTAVVNGGKNIAVTGTAVQLPSGACSGAVITANSTNAASIFVGLSSVTKDYGATTSGAELQPGQSIGVAIDNLNRLYVNGTSGDGVNWLAS